MGKPSRLENNQASSSHGGARKGAGRKPGSATKKTREIADKAAEDGITPLEFLLKAMRDESRDPRDRMTAAISAAPYVHPKLSSIDLKADIATHEASLDDLA